MTKKRKDDSMKLPFTPEELESAENLERQILSEKMGDVFEKATETYDLEDFAYSFLQSRTFSEYFVDATIFSQSKGYVLEILDEDDAFQSMLPKEKDKDIPADKETAHWMGYLFAMWVLKNHVDPKTINRDTIKWLYEGFDTLHTVDVQYCYDLYMENREAGKEERE